MIVKMHWGHGAWPKSEATEEEVVRLVGKKRIHFTGKPLLELCKVFNATDEVEYGPVVVWDKDYEDDDWGAFETFILEIIKGTS